MQLLLKAIAIRGLHGLTRILDNNPIIVLGLERQNFLTALAIAAIVRWETQSTLGIAPAYLVVRKILVRLF